MLFSTASLQYSFISRGFCNLVLYASVIFMLGFASLSSSHAQTQPIDFSADEVTSNAETGVVIATGNVVFNQGAMQLKADRVEYDRNNGRAIATGNIIFVDNDGNTHYTDTLELENNFADAFAEPIISQFSDGSWLGAANVDYSAENGTSFEDSDFTPCNCDFKEGETPVWSLKTSSSNHDTKTKTVFHKNVIMHLYDVPIMYFPFLSHPDWTVRRRSGLLPPQVSFSSDFGTSYAQSYYWVTGKTHDLEITPHIFGSKGRGVETKYRQRWDESTLNAKVYFGRLNTFKNSQEDVAGIDANFSTLLADNWLTKVTVQRASQDTFMRRYNFNDLEELKVAVLTERIDRSRYTRIEANDIQDLKKTSNPEAEPTVLPSVFHERYLETAIEDLTLRLRMSALQLNNDDYTDVKRWSSELYARQDVGTNYGNLGFEARVSGQYRNIETPTKGVGYTGELGQATASIGVAWSQPIAINFQTRSAIIEPKIKFVSTKATDRSTKLPNRDSSDFRLDEANLFLLHREQGEDYNITNTRLDGGASLSMWDNTLGDVTGFIGSSVRLFNQTPRGLNAAADNDRYSDILASLTIQPDQLYSLSMSGRFHPRTLELNETQVKASLYLDKTRLGLSYNQLSNSFFNTATEETETVVLTAYQDLGHQWSANVSQTYETTNKDRKLSDTSVTLEYAGGLQDCLTISIGYTRDSEDDRDIKPVDEVFLLFNFKYLGSVSTSGIGS